VYALFDRVRHSVGERAQGYRSLITSDFVLLRRWRGTLEIFAIAKISTVSAPAWDELLASAHASAWASVLAWKLESKSPWRSRLRLPLP